MDGCLEHYSVHAEKTGLKSSARAQRKKVALAVAMTRDGTASAHDDYDDDDGLPKSC